MTTEPERADGEGSRQHRRPDGAGDRWGGICTRYRQGVSVLKYVTNGSHINI